MAHLLDAATAAMPEKEVKSAVKPDDPPVANPEYALWVAKDQQVFNYLLSSVSRDVQIQVAGATTAAELWTAISEMTASQSRGRVINTRMALATAQKGSSTIADFFSKVKSLADDMAAAGKRLDDEEVASYILTGLDNTYDPVVSLMSSHTERITLGELYTQLVSWEQRMDLSAGGSGSSANTMSRGGRGGFIRGGGGRGRGGRGRGRGNNNNGGRRQNKGDGPICQLCSIEGHTVIRCFKRFDATFTSKQQEQRQASSADYGIDTNWYTDTGATDHITGELEKLTTRDKYTDNDQVHTASGAGMRISQIGHSTIRTPSRDLILNNVLYVP